MTTADLINAHLRHLESLGRRSLVTIAHNLKHYRLWLEAEELEVGDVSGIQAENYQTALAIRTDAAGSLHYSSKSVASKIWVVTRFHGWLHENGHVSRNAFRHVPRMKINHHIPREVPTPPDLAAKLNAIARFWDTPNTRDQRTLYRLHVMAEVLYATGMRLGELGGLEPIDFDLDAKTVRVKDGKGGMARIAYLTDYAASVVGIYLERMREVVHYRFGAATVFGTLDGQCLGGILNRQLRLHVGMTSHGFRHAVGTHLLSAGCDLRLIQLILGHEDLKSTAIYTKVAKEELRDQLDRHHPRSHGHYRGFGETAVVKGAADEVCDQPRRAYCHEQF